MLVSEPMQTARLGYRKMDDAEKADILRWVHEHQRKGWPLERIVKWIGVNTGRHTTSIYRFLKSVRSTTRLAEAKLLAGAARMVDRIADDGQPKELIDVLSRPNIGVLSPIGNKTKSR